MATTQPDASEIRRRGRQRLIGAVAIALLLIVFVPMLLDSEPRAKRDEPKMEIPPRESAPPLPAPVAAPPEKAPAVVAPAPVDEAKKAAPKVAKVEPRPEAKAGFAVQVGAFADDGHMQQVKGKLALENIVVYSEKAGSLTRLRVGPFPTRDAAEKSLSDVRKVVPDAKVVSLP